MKYLIKIESTPHGVLGVRHAGFDQQYCEAGEQVILKWQPDAKWGLQEAHYTDGDGNITPIDLTPVKVDGMDVVVFTMPDNNITVGGTFKRFVLEDWTGDAAESPIFNEHIDATDQQRNTALANVSNQTANSTTGKMGYKVLDGSKSFASQVTAENTIYEIRDVFDGIGTQEIPFFFPQGCTLKFNGGKISDSYISGDGIIIEHDGKNFDNCSMTITNYKKSVSPRMFGDDTAAIQKAIDSFPASSICLDGKWEYNSKIIVPYDIALYCNYGEIELSSPQTTLFDIYCSHNSLQLKNFQVNLTSTYTGTVINVYGVNASHSSVRGYISTLERNLSDVDVWFPNIFGTRISGVIGIHITSTDLFYFKTFHSYGYNIDTHIRLEKGSGTNGLNSCKFYINSWLCNTGLSMNSGLNKSIIVYMIYQCYSSSVRAISRDSFDAATSIDTGIYNITLWDPAENAVLIDNANNATFITNGDSSLTSLSTHFANKSKTYTSYTNNNLSSNTIAYPQGIDINLRSVQQINNTIGSSANRISAINSVLKLIKRLRIQSNIGVDIMCGYYYYIDSAIQGKLKKLIFDANETEVITMSGKVRIHIVFCLDSTTAAKYNRFFTEVYDFDNNILLQKHTTITYTDDDVTGLTDNLKSISPITAKSVASTNRPTLDDSAIGYMIYDKTLNQPIWYKGSGVWIDATGTTV